MMQFIDLKSQQARLRPGIGAAIDKVLSHGQYINGPEVEKLEQILGEFSGAEFALGCSNGTDALMLALMAFDIGHGDAVFCPSFTYSATAESIAVLGATPIFVDVEPDHYNMCPDSLERAIAKVSAEGKLHPRAVITVDLFGQCANYPLLVPIARRHGLKIISDAAQSFGGTLEGVHPIHWADIMTTSFFPAKPLGCYGDGGAIFTNDPDLMRKLDSLRVHGRGRDKYDNIYVGLNSRLDTLQAAILLEKMSIFSDEIEMRNTIASRYIEGLKSNSLKTPSVIAGGVSTWAQFTIEVEQPEALGEHLKGQGIPAARYYPIPTHLQTAYIGYPRDPQGLAITETVMKKVISLPMHPYLDEDQQAKIITAIKDFKP